MTAEDDCPPNPSGLYVTQVACLKAHLKLEHRLTLLEALNALTLLAAISTFLGIVFFIWRG